MRLDPASDQDLADIFFSHEGNLSDKWEHYLAIYAAEFGRYQAACQPVSLLEIGVQNGGSLQIWAKYLPPGSTIVGIDIDPACAGLRLGPTIEVLIGDAGSPETLDRLLEQRRFDIIVDDGSHRSDDIRSTFGACFRRLKPGGIYIVEDLHCSFIESFGGGLRRAGAAVEFFKTLCDGLNVDHIDEESIGRLDVAEVTTLRLAGKDISRITFYDSVVVVERAAEPKLVPFRRVMTGSDLPVHSPAAAIAGTARADLGRLILSESMTRSLAPLLLENLVGAREEIGRLKDQRAAALPEREAADKAAAPLAEQAALAANEREAIRALLMDLKADNARQKQLETDNARLQEEIARLRHEEAFWLAQGAALNEERRALSTDRSKVEAEARTLRMERDAALSERYRLAVRLGDVLASTSWQVTAPARLAVRTGQRVGRIPARLTAAKRHHGSWSGTIVALGEFSGLNNPRKAFAKLRLARRQMGSWREVGRRLQGYIARKGVTMAFKQFRNYGDPAANVGVPSVIAARYAGIHADIAQRIAAHPLVPPGSDDITDGPLISIILPIYRVPVSLLDKAIGSVVAQSYPRWELCIVDDGSGQAALTERLRRHAASDSRIKLHLSQTNGGIAAASNQALALASGDYVGFLDHDDVLTCDAVYWIGRAVADEPDTDVIYTDECKIDDIDDVREVFSKPDWSPAFLLNSMYIGHLTVYRRSLIAQIGGLRSEFDFSQDYDLALRATEGPAKVRHIDRVLYCWRSTNGSAAAGHKPFARQSNIAALKDALDRRGYAADAISLPTANWVSWTRDDLRGRVSVIIPSDNPRYISDCVQSIRDKTTYPDYEIIVVTRSAIADGLSNLERRTGVRFARYDKPYNFSDKCNFGAAVAEGAHLVFVNDDVRVISEDWIEALMGCLRIEGVGAAAPKMLYEDGSIQHAGLVTGVRRLVGTAFHTLAADDSRYFNMAQSLREASSVSGACLMMPVGLFKAINGYDAINTPIAHSDVDLCFRLADLGYRSVYTPHATLLHLGHQSLATYERGDRHEAARPATPNRRPKDKADIHLLRTWPDRIARDPYFPPRMKELVYIDSPEDFDIYPAAPKGAGGLDILILSHDLTNSGAPRIVFDMVRVLAAAGHFVVVMSPADGFFRKPLVEAGATVIVEPLLFSRDETVLDFARNFDRVIANTVVMLPLVLQLSPVVDVYWYIHESQMIADEFHGNPEFVRALGQAKQVWANSKRSLRFITPRTDDVRVVEYGVDAPSFCPVDDEGGGQAERPAEFIIVGSYEPRKGQDLAIAGIQLLPERIRERCRFSFFGRVLDPKFHDEICAEAKTIPEVTIGPELTHAECREVMRRVLSALVPASIAGSMKDESF